MAKGHNALGLAGLGMMLGHAISNGASTAAKGVMGHNANLVSRAAQGAQAQFNGTQAALANQLGTERLAQQYNYNAGQAMLANDFSQSSFNQAMDFNREMMQLQMQYNSDEAQKNREWQERMRATAYQTAVKDMTKAGLNPILAVTGGGISTGGGSGSAASVSSPSMSGMQGSMASGGLLNGEKANISNYTGQLEYMGGIMGLLSTAVAGMSNAFTVMSQSKEVNDIMNGLINGMYDTGRNAVGGMFMGPKNENAIPHYRNGKWTRGSHSSNGLF